MLIRSVIQAIFVIVGVAFYTLLERKILGYVQTRKGPNKPGPLGLLVPFADAIKLFTKEINTPTTSNKSIFILVPGGTIIVPLILWCVYPGNWFASKFTLLYIICISAIGVYWILGAGWGSNSKYSTLGAIRAVAQSISYEVCLSLIILHCLVIYLFSNLTPSLPLAYIILPLILLFFLSRLAETNRSPFDFAEGESELVRGFNTEYASVRFVIIFLAEYISILFISVILSLLFLSRAIYETFLFLLITGTLFIWARGTLPRFRYDQLMYIAWKSILPAVLCTICVVSIL